jgi:AraC-like DNA-binding protein
MPRSQLDNLRLRTDEPLIWLRGARHEVYQKKPYFYDCRRRNEREHVVLQVVLAGEGFYRSARDHRLLSSGMAWLDVVPGPFEYGVRPGSPGPFELVFLSIDGRAAFDLRNMIVGRFGAVFDLGPAPNVVEQMRRIARQNESESLPNRYELSAQVYQLLCSIMSMLSTTRSAGETRVRELQRYIEQHFLDAEMSIERVAAQAGWSQAHMSREFKQVVGVSAQSYLQKLRLRRAGDLLRTGTATLEQVARKSGFGTANYLCRMFRKYVGATPAEFRRRTWMTVE